MDDETKLSKAELLAKVDAGWNKFQAYLATLSDAQMTIPTDAAGWTAKDNVAHLAAWEDTVNALFDRELRWQHLGVDHDLWVKNDWDAINAIIQQRYHDMPLADVQAMWLEIHQRLVGKVKTRSDADLRRPYYEYQSDSTYDLPAIHWVIIDTYPHYEEHQEYIAAIVAKAPELMNKTQLLDAINAGWDKFQAYLTTLTYEQATIPTDAAGWTVKDHIAHLMVWEDSMNAMLDKRSRREQMGVPEDIWGSRDFDRINGVIQQRNKDISLMDLHQGYFAVHDRLLAKIGALSDADLQTPYKVYQPDSQSETPIVHYLAGDTYEHYAQHQPWIAAIVEGEPDVMSKAQLLDVINRGWDDLNAYLDTLSEAQLTQSTDAGGWTVKDHVIHLAIWEDAMNALLEGKSRQQQMQIDDATWATNDDDQINAVIQRQYKDFTWAQVQEKRSAIHQRLIDRISAMSDADLARPFNFYEPSSSYDSPVIRVLVGNTFAHYATHQPWIAAIADSAQGQ